jgi:hypothetical protein
MPARAFFIDANLLLLLVVGSVGQDLIVKHKRLQAYTREDYEILIDLISQVSQVLVTPNTLTETSNLLGLHREPERSRFFNQLRRVIDTTVEIVVPSSDAARNSAFTRLGLTDGALLELATSETPVVTTDVGLYLAATNAIPDSAINFNHLRGL